MFKIHPLTTEDILMEEGREKCEVFLNYYFVSFRTFVLESDGAQVLLPSSIYMLILPDGVISVSNLLAFSVSGSTSLGDN